MIPKEKKAVQTGIPEKSSLYRICGIIPKYIQIDLKSLIWYNMRERCE